MSLCGKMEAEIEMKAPADKVFEFYTCLAYQMSKSSPEMLQSVDLQKGQWGKKGSILCWNYLIDGKVEKIKMITEEIDYRNKSATYKTIEGDLLEFYKSFSFILQVTPREEGSLVHWSFEYEKLNANIPNPETTLPAVVHACKDIDAHLTQAKTQSSPQLQ
ncbi:MLP-like protein 28 [Pistacia vera]|uniref:MLP-like protein 28 n=1 Tax=Pistacia vera TaxID=55513 RepID=UPI001262DA02|nr:MLP-like protein 28 [Pistacia vera]